MDVAKIGACGVCMFGKSISTEQVRLLKLTCAGKHIIVMLDPDASNDAKKIVNALTNKDPFMPDTFLSVTDAGLTDKDPGDHTTEELQAAIAKVIK
jgi:5S rRNA maturation endonuclease (ribonuclease M5)